MILQYLVARLESKFLGSWWRPKNVICNSVVALLESKFWEAGGDLRMPFVILWWFYLEVVGTPRS